MRAFVLYHIPVLFMPRPLLARSPGKCPRWLTRYTSPHASDWLSLQACLFKVNKKVGQGLASAIETGEKAAGKTKETLGKQMFKLVQRRRIMMILY